MEDDVALKQGDKKIILEKGDNIKVIDEASSELKSKILNLHKKYKDIADKL